MPFQPGPKSQKELLGVHPYLVAVVHRCFDISPIDFAVHDGLRTPEEQAEYLRTGVTKTLNSKHLKQADGFGHAVDLVPYVNGKLRWEWGPIYILTLAFRQACVETHLDATWGAIWDRKVHDLPDTDEGLRAAVKEYCDRHPGPDFLDGPHFQID